jgi:hypothetical protein
MRLPPSVHVVLGSSRTAGMLIGALAAATLALIVAMPLHALLQMTSIAAVVAWAGWAFHGVAVRRGRFAITELHLAPDLILVACMGDGRLVAGHVRASTYVGSWVTSIVWRPDGAQLSRTILLLPDMLPTEDFRRLRVMLRYARSGDAQDLPASQA